MCLALVFIFYWVLFCDGVMEAAGEQYVVGINGMERLMIESIANI